LVFWAEAWRHQRHTPAKRFTVLFFMHRSGGRAAQEVFMDMTLTDFQADGALTQDAIDIRNLTQAQLMQLGMSQLAYVKPVWMDGTTAFAIFAADGSPMAVAADCDLAVAAIVQHEMVPALVH